MAYHGVYRPTDTLHLDGVLRFSHAGRLGPWLAGETDEPAKGDGVHGQPGQAH